MDFKEDVDCNIFPLNKHITGFHCTWKIFNFFEVSKAQETLRMMTDLNLSITSNCFFNFEIQAKESNIFMSVKMLFDQDKSNVEDIGVLFRFSLLDDKRNHIYVSSFKMVQLGSETGTRQLVFEEPVKSILPGKDNPYVTILLEGGIVTENSLKINDKQFLTTLLNIRLRTLKISLKTLFAEKYKDVCIALSGTRDPERYHVAKLLGHSEILDSKIMRAYREQRYPRTGFCTGLDDLCLELRGVDAPIFKELVLYMYTGAVSKNFDSMADILLTNSSIYCIPHMKDLCENKLIANISIETAARYFMLSCQYKAERLKSTVIEFIKENCCAVMRSGNYRAYIETHSKLKNELASFVPDILIEPLCFVDDHFAKKENE